MSVLFIHVCVGLVPLHGLNALSDSGGLKVPDTGVTYGTVSAFTFTANTHQQPVKHTLLSTVKNKKNSIDKILFSTSNRKVKLYISFNTNTEPMRAQPKTPRTL